MSVVSVYATFASEDEAQRIGRAVVDEKLAACVNILGRCTSIYRWNGPVEQADEVAAIFKTIASAADGLIARIAELHSYDVPAIAVWPIDKLHSDYARWVEDSVEPSRVS